MGTTTHNYINIEFSSKETFDRFKERFMAVPSSFNYWEDFIIGNYHYFDGNNVEEQHPLILDFNKIIPITSEEEDHLGADIYDNKDLKISLVNFMAENNIQPNTKESKEVINHLEKSINQIKYDKAKLFLYSKDTQETFSPIIMNMTENRFIEKYYNNGKILNEKYQKYYEGFREIYKDMNDQWGNSYGWDIEIDLDLKRNEFNMNFDTKHTSPYNIFTELRKKTLELDPKSFFLIETYNIENAWIEVWDNDGMHEYGLDDNPQSFLYELEKRKLGYAEDWGYAYNEEKEMYTQEDFYE